MHVLYGPFTPGESPFLVKGGVYLNVLASYDERVPGGARAVLERIEDSAASLFFTQKFEASSSYDVLPLIELGQVASRLAGVPWRDFVRAGAAYQADTDAGGIYHLFLKIASPKMTIERLPRILIQYFNFGSIDGHSTSDSQFEATARGIPKPIVSWLHASAEGFIPALLRTTGATDIGVAVHLPEREGSLHGMDLCSVRFGVTWR